MAKLEQGNSKRPHALRRVSASLAVRLLARGGLAMRSLTYLIIGVLAGGIAVGVDGNASQAGAMASIAETGVGRVLLWVAVACLAGLALWQFAQVAWIDTPSAVKRVWRASLAVAKAAGFTIAAGIALVFAIGTNTANTRVLPVIGEILLDTVSGTIVLAMSGGIVMAVGIGAIVRGVRLTFFDELEQTKMAVRARWLIGTSGRIGYVSKGFSITLVGVLLVLASIFVDPSRVGGLDGALSRLAAAPYGRVVLVVVAAGLLVNGLYLILRTVFLPQKSHDSLNM